MLKNIAYSNFSLIVETNSQAQHHILQKSWLLLQILSLAVAKALEVNRSKLKHTSRSHVNKQCLRQNETYSRFRIAGYFCRFEHSLIIPPFPRLGIA